MNDLMAKELRKQSHSETGNEIPDFRPFFAPRSVAVIGASPAEGNLGKSIVESLLHQGYGGTLFTVHPKGKQVADCPVVQEIPQLPDTVELAVIAVSAEKIPLLLQPLADRGIRHLIIISAGFSETGDRGKQLQDQIKMEARRLGLRIIGPNGMGVFSAPDRFNSFFVKPGQWTLPKPGSVALISQSGAFLIQILGHLGELGVGVHRAVNFGNRMDIGECELLEEFARDPEVRVIGLYLESVEDGTRFMTTVRSITRHKPVVVLKGGKAVKGQQAARAHSAALAGSYSVFQAVCRKTGMIEVNGLEPMIDALQLFQARPQAQGDRILVVTNGGGMGVLLTDLCEQAGLRMPELSRQHQSVLKERNPAYYSFRNPIDVTGSGTNEQVVSIVEYLMETGEYDALLLVLMSGAEGINAEIGAMLNTRLPDHLPIVAGAYGPLFEPILANLREREIPVFPTGERAARNLELWVHQSLWMRETPETGRSIPTAFETEPVRHWLRELAAPPHEMQIKNLLGRSGIPVPQHIHVKGSEDLEWAMQYIGFPLTLKVVGPDIIHKTEMKGLRLDLNDRSTLVREWEALETVWPNRVWAEQQMPPGLDLMVGAHRDPQFGPVLLFGTGGSYVELFHDIARWVLPAMDAEILRGVRETKAWQVVQGFRGKPQLNAERLLALLKWAADWILAEPDMRSLDFNPVRLYEKDLVVLDAKITQVS